MLPLGGIKIPLHRFRHGFSRNINFPTEFPTSYQQTPTLLQILHSNPRKICIHFSNPQPDFKSHLWSENPEGTPCYLK